MARLLDVQGATVRYGRFEALGDVSLGVSAGSIVGLIGPNGAGKTTMIDAVTGFVPGARGAVLFDGRRVERLPPYARARLGMARTFQGLDLFEDLTVAENLAVAAEARPGRRGAGPQRPGAETGRLFGDGLEEVREELPLRLPHRLRNRLALARALAAAPRLLLLDEPFAGLDAPDRASVAATLRGLAGDGMGILLVDHDAGLVFDLCDEVCVLDFGRVISHGPPHVVRADAGVRAAYLGPERPHGAGGTGPERPHGAGGAGGPESAHRPDRNRGGAGHPVPAIPGAPLLEVEHLSAGYGEVPVLRDVSLRVGSGEVVALLGANGAGKTTALLAISGVLAPSAGEVRVLGKPVGVPDRNGDAGERQARLSVTSSPGWRSRLRRVARARPERVARLGVGHAPQDRGVTPGLTVAESLRLGARGDPAGVGEALTRFPRCQALLSRRGGELSGGEQQVVNVARALAARPRVLLVDEPSLGLGPGLMSEVLATLRALADELGMAILLVEQHAYLALGVADRAYVMSGGRVVLEGSAAELSARPGDLEAAYLGGGPAAAP